jgi:tripartite-type tricarboxylate transporter receptor subunit TctC
MSFARALATAALLAGAIHDAAAEWTPTRPIRVVVPFAAGGGADMIVRRLADRIKQEIGQPIVVDNRPGAGTAIGAVAVASSPPDGHTLMLATSTTLCVNPIIRTNLPYKVDDFAPVAVLQALPFMLLVPKQLPVNSLRELVQYARERPGKLNYGTLGIGTANHILGGTLSRSGAVDIVPLHYASGAPILLALTQGDVHLYFDGISTSVPRVKSGQLKGLAVTSKERLEAVPDIPTIAEQGFPELTVSIWYGLIAPARTPSDAVERLNAVVNRIMATREMSAALIAEGTRNMLISPQAYAQLIKDDTATWRKSIEPLKLKLE